MSDVHASQPDADLSGINLYIPLPFRVSLIIIGGIWAWGLNFYYLSAIRIDVQALIKYSTSKGASASPHQRIFRLAWVATIVQAAFLGIFLVLTHGDADAVVRWDIVPMLHLFLQGALFILPLQRLSKTGRYRFLSTLKRISIGGIAQAQDGKFGDILLADALTSYARVLGDLVAVFLMFFTPKQSATGPPNRSNGGEIMIPLVISIPSMIRLRQCLIEYDRVRKNQTRVSGWGGQHLANALKYSTAFPVIILTAVQRTSDGMNTGLGENMLGRLWILAALVNSLYSFYWDVTKDWDLTLLTDERNNIEYPWGLRRQRYFNSDFIYYGVIAMDLILRLTWVTRLTPHLTVVNRVEGGVFLLQFLEAFRRWIWIFFRTEAEWLRSQEISEDNVLLDDIDSIHFQD